MSFLSTRPELISAILARSFRLYRAEFLRVFLLSLAGTIFLFGPQIFVLAHEYDSMLFDQPRTAAIKIMVLLICDLLWFIYLSAIIWHVYQSVQAAPTRTAQAILIGIKKLPQTVMGLIIGWLLMVLSSMPGVVLMFYLIDKKFLFVHDMLSIFISAASIFLQILPCTYVFVLLVFYLPLIINEDKNVFTALRHSITLVWKNWWRTFWILVIPWLVFAIGVLSIEVFFRWIKNTYGVQIPVSGYILKTSVEAIVFTLLLPWFASVIIIQLHDLKLQKNGSVHFLPQR